MLIKIPARNSIPATQLYCEIFQSTNPNKNCPTLILHPGGPGGNHTVYYQIKDALLPYANLVLFDPRGCGKSEKAETQYCTLDNYIDDLEALRMQLKIENPIILGGSFGAMVALGYGIRHHDKLAKLILLCGAVDYGFLELAKRNLKQRGTPEQIKIAEKLWRGEFQSAEEFDQYYKIMASMYIIHYEKDMSLPTTREKIPYNVEVLNLGFKKFLREFDFNHDLHKITVPTLIIAGDKDWITDPSESIRMHQGIKNSELRILKDSGHFSWIDNPGEFYKTITNFIIAS